jgi:antirestriction protein ArdC
MSVYQSVLASLTDAIARGADRYEMPWHAAPGRSALPINATTGVAYQGLNILLLWGALDQRAYTTNLWATYKQWAALRAQVRRGERAVACVKWKDLPVDDGEDRRLLPLGFSLFNADQVDGFITPDARQHVDAVQGHAAADAIVASLGIPVGYAGDQAYYRPAIDDIVMPDRWRFRDTSSGDATQNHYAVLLHECIHATGHKSRLDRDFQQRFSTDARAFEELVTEIGCAFACARLGLHNKPRSDHAPYIASWLKVLKDQPSALSTAASQAQRACNFLFNRLAAPQQLAA